MVYNSRHPAYLLVNKSGSKLPQQLPQQLVRLIRIRMSNRSSLSRPVQRTEGESRPRTVNDNNLSKPNRRSPYPGDVVAVPGAVRAETRKRLNLNGDFARENEYLIGTNCLPTRGVVARSSEVGERDNRDAGAQDNGGGVGRSLQGKFFFCLGTGTAS